MTDRGGDEHGEGDGSAARAAVLALLARRDVAATVCPSEVARVLAAGAGRADAWRGEMAGVHAAVDRLVAEGVVRLSWKGAGMVVRTGPYRIGRVSVATDPT